MLTMQELEARLESLSGKAGVACPPVKVGRKRSAFVSYWDDQTLGLTIPKKLLRQSGTIIDGTLGHELAHIAKGDVKSVPKARLRRLQFQYTLAMALPILISAGTTIGLLGRFNVSTFSLASDAAIIASVVTMLAFARWSARSAKRDGRATQYNEMRADLYACQLVGKASIAESLSAFHKVNSGPLWLRQLRLTKQAANAILTSSTHPPVKWRLAAINGYDLAESPDSVARRFLTAARSGESFRPDIS